MQKNNRKTNHAVLLVSCPDRKGIVMSTAGFLYHHGANILHADQHKDSKSNLFFMRIEWDMTGFNLNEHNFARAFLPVAENFKMSWHLSLTDYIPKIAIFISREDHCLADLLYRHKRGELNCEIPLIISNHPEGKTLADFYRIPYYTVPTDAPSNITEKEELKLLKKFRIDLVILAKYMRILSPDFLKKFQNPIINIHHSFLPAFVGSRPYHQAYERGVKIIGATSHYVTEKLDQGPIIEQDVIRISHRDSVNDLIRKGRDLEKIVLSRAVNWHLQSKVLSYGNKTVVFD